MAGGGDLGFYIGSYDGTGGGGTPDADATLFLTSRGYTQSRGYEYWDSLNSLYKKWNGAAWLTVGGGGAASPWSEAAGVLYPTTFGTDDVVVGANAMAGAERFRVAGDARFDGQIGIHTAPLTTKVIAGVDDLSDTGGTTGIDVELELAGASGPKSQWLGFSAYLNHTGSQTLTGSKGFFCDSQPTGSGTMTSHEGFNSSLVVGASATVTDYYGFRAASPSVTGTLTNAYGLRIDAQNGATLSYGIYQGGASDGNYFAGTMGLRTNPLTTKVIAGVDDLSDTGGTTGIDVELELAGASGPKSQWLGFSAYLNHTGSQTLTSSKGFFCDSQPTGSGTMTSHEGFNSSLVVGASATVTDYYGFRAESPSVTGTLTNAYGVRIDAQNGATLSYGIYQAGASDGNYFAGRVGVNQTTVSSTNYVEVLDDDESATKYAFRAKLEKDAAGAKTTYSGLRTTAAVSDGSVTTLRHVQAATVTSGGDVTEGTGYYSIASAGSGDTIATARGLYLADAIGAGTITTAYGIDIEDQGLSSDTTYGIRVRDQSGTATYGVYQEGSDDLNYFAGNSGIGVTPDATAVLKIEEAAASGGGLDGININLNKTAAGTITTWIPLEIDTTVTSGTVTTMNGILIGAPAGGGTISTLRGIRISSLKNGPASGITPTAISQAGSNDENELHGETGIGAGADSGVSQLYVQRDESGTIGATRAGIHVQLNYNTTTGPAAITDFRAIDIDIANKNTDTTSDITAAYGVRVNSPTGLGGDIGFAAAFYCEDMELDTDVLAGWGVYQNGATTKNYFAGVIGAMNSIPSTSYAIDAGANINTSENYYVDGTQVVTNRQAAIADVAVSGSHSDGTARAKINGILTALRAHGLIAP
jgi:hypothetical protein